MLQWVKLFQHKIMVNIMSSRKKIEIPGASSEELQVVNEAQQRVDNIVQAAQRLARKKESIVSTLGEEKYNESEHNINVILEKAKSYLEDIKSYAQVRAAQPKKNINMNGITISKPEQKILTGKNIRLTDQGYIVD